MSDIIKLHDLEFKPLIKQSEINERVEDIAHRLSDKIKGKDTIFIVVLKGAFAFATQLFMFMDGDYGVTFVRLSSYQGLQSSGEMEVKLNLSESIEGKTVVIVEDIVDSGKTMFEYKTYLETLNPENIIIVSLLVKPSALKYPVNVDFRGFNIDDKFVVGYGLDYKELGRNLNGIYQIIDHSQTQDMTIDWNNK